ncbi:S9 family peptidase [Aliikangiella sp. IMCC44653]
MHLNKLIAVSLAALIITGCGQSDPKPTDNQLVEKNMPKTYPRLKSLPQPAPKAMQIPYTYSYHGVEVSDPFHWLKDPSYPNTDDKAVLDYLNKENEYFQAFLEPQKALVDELFEEFKGRVDEKDASVPYIYNGYEYWEEYQADADYPLQYRKNLANNKSEIYLDEQALSKGHEYFVIGDIDISPDNQLVAYSLDTAGDERYDIFVRNIATGELLDVTISDSSGQVEFVGDSKTLAYVRLDEKVWRGESVNIHRIGANKADQVLFTESDKGFFLSAFLTSSEEWLAISTGHKDVNEILVFNAKDLDQPAKKLLSRDAGIKANIDHANGKFYLLTNDKHVNFRLAEVADDQPANAQWNSILEGDDKIYLRSFKAFANQLVVKLRHDGLDAIRVLPYTGEAYDVEFPESVFAASLSTNPNFDQAHVRLSYQSMITPSTIYDFDFSKKQLQLRKQKKIPSGYDKTQYETKRLMAPARDGKLIPVSIVYKKGFKQDGTHPMSLYAYGAYGMGMSPSFSSSRLSLLDRGFSFAIAHTRGGDEMGYNWYLDGKMDNRVNAFNDFVDVAHYLIKEKYTDAGNISIAGGSAGGEMMGAVILQAPELWRSVTLMVPFVDVLNTMLDESLPLTPPEWVEWGNPIESKKYFDLIRSYSPYDNIEKRDYPPMMVTGGLNDPRVTYWEPAKWTAKMRATKTDDNLLVMRINMGAGHFANSGRYGRLRDRAEEMAFQLLAHQAK